MSVNDPDIGGAADCSRPADGTLGGIGGMGSLLFGFTMFAELVIAHIVLWRIRRPTDQYRALFYLSLTVLFVSLGVVVSIVPALSAFDCVNAVVLYIALGLAYVTTYSAIQADSPTMSMLLLIAAAGPRGLTFGELVAQLNDDVLVLPRLADLVRGKLATLEGQRYVIGAKGALMARIHVRYRAVLAMERGG